MADARRPAHHRHLGGRRRLPALQPQLRGGATLPRKETMNMEFWTVLWITILGGPLDGTRMYLLYPSYEECFANHQTVAQTLSYDYYQVECEETTTASRSIRPAPRPEGLADG
jgi:hypothetical protein